LRALESIGRRGPRKQLVGREKVNPVSIRASFERSDSEPRAWRALFCFSPFSGERDLRHVHLAVWQHAEAHSDGAGLLARNVARLGPHPSLPGPFARPFKFGGVERGRMRHRATPTGRTSARNAQHYTGEAILPADAPSHKHTTLYPTERSICVQMHGNAAVVRRGQVPREASALFSDADESSDDMGLPSRRSRQDKERAHAQALVRSGFSDSESEPECSSNMPANRKSLKQGRAAHATTFRTADVGMSASAVGKQGNTALSSFARSWASRLRTTADQVSYSEYSSDDDSELLSRLDLAGEGQNLPCHVSQPLLRPYPPCRCVSPLGCSSLSTAW
jgi:hypothetical protein